MPITVQHGGAAPLLEYLAGFSASRQKKKLQQAQQQALENQQLYGGLGQGLGNFAQSYALRSGQLQDAAQRQNYALGLQNNAAAHELQQIAARTQSAMDIQKQRDAADIYQSAAHDYARIYGEEPSSTPMTYQPQPMDMIAPEANMTDAATGMPMAAPLPEQGGVPAPVSNPAMTREYKNAQSSLVRLQDQRHLAAINPNLAPVDKQSQLQAFDQAIMRQQSILSRYPTPKPPTTEEELRQAGPMNGGFTELSDGTRVYGNGKGGLSFHDKASKPSAENVQRLLSWTKETNPLLREQGRQQFLMDSFGGDAEQYAEFKKRGGYASKIDLSTGEVTWHEPPKDSEGSGKQIFGDVAKNYDAMFNNLTTKEFGTVKTPKPQEVAAELKNRNSGIKQYIIDQKGLQPIADRLGDLLRQSKALAQKGESDVLVESEIAKLRKQLEDAMRE